MFADKVLQTLASSTKNIIFYFDVDGSKNEGAGIGVVVR